LRFFACRFRAAFAALCVAAAIPVSPAGAASAATEVPAWFKETFLDIREDVREAAAEGKRLLLYFGQDGCPYWKRARWCCA
jgi:thioredoxin-related protein